MILKCHIFDYHNFRSIEKNISDEEWSALICGRPNFASICKYLVSNRKDYQDWIQQQINTNDLYPFTGTRSQNLFYPFMMGKIDDEFAITVGEWEN